MSCVMPHERPVMVVDDSLLCARHTRKLRRDLDRVTAAAAWVRANAGRSSSAALSERVSTSREPLAPLRFEHVDLVLQIEVALAGWARFVARQRGVMEPLWTGLTDLNGRPIPKLGQLPEMVAFLRRHLEWLVRQSFVVEVADELSELLREAYGLQPWAPGVHRLPAPCPTCDTRALVRFDGDETVRCSPKMGGCGREWTWEDYERLVLVLASDAKEAAR